MREIHFEIHISSKQYSSDTSITGSHFLRHFFFIGGCPTVPVSNVSLSLSWACDPYIGEQIILHKLIVMMMLFWNSLTPLCRPVDLRQLLRSYKCCLRSSHNTGNKNTEYYIYQGLALFFFFFIYDACSYKQYHNESAHCYDISDHIIITKITSHILYLYSQASYLKSCG